MRLGIAEEAKPNIWVDYALVRKGRGPLRQRDSVAVAGVGRDQKFGR